MLQDGETGKKGPEKLTMKKKEKWSMRRQSRKTQGKKRKRGKKSEEEQTGTGKRRECDEKKKVIKKCTPEWK